MNKTVVVTGGSTGIGKAICLEFAKNGFNVVIDYASDDKTANDALREVSTFSEGIAVKADITDEKQVKILFEKAKKHFGRVDVLVNNAGIMGEKDFFESRKNDWLDVINVDLIGTVLCSKEAAKLMLRQKSGKIVNISSIRGIPEYVREGALAYGAAKAGIINFTKGLAKVLAPHVNVNCVAPGPVDTGIFRRTSAKIQKETIDKTALKRAAKPEEIAKAVFYLASEDADYITGTVLVIDGGYCLK